jgi:hypothetical protein
MPVSIPPGASWYASLFRENQYLSWPITGLPGKKRPTSDACAPPTCFFLIQSLLPQTETKQHCRTMGRQMQVTVPKVVGHPLQFTKVRSSSNDAGYPRGCCPQVNIGG